MVAKSANGLGLQTSASSGILDVANEVVALRILDLSEIRLTKDDLSAVRPNRKNSAVKNGVSAVTIKQHSKALLPAGDTIPLREKARAKPPKVVW